MLDFRTGTAELKVNPGVGYHKFTWLERIGSAVTATMYGQSTDGSGVQLRYFLAGIVRA